MAGKNLGDLRALMKDHWERDQGLSVNADICLEVFKVTEHKRLKTERERLVEENRKQGSMAGPDTADLDRQIEELLASMEGSWVKLHFRQLSGPVYRRMINEDGQTEPDDPSPQVRQARMADFQAAVAGAMYTGCTWDGTRFSSEDMPWAEWEEKAGFAQMEQAILIAFAQQTQWMDDPRPEARPF